MSKGNSITVRTTAQQDRVIKINGGPTEAFNMLWDFWVRNVDLHVEQCREELESHKDLIKKLNEKPRKPASRK